MWFCYKCNRWYCDSVTIVKHFQKSHNSNSTDMDNRSHVVSKTKLIEPPKRKSSIPKVSVKKKLPDISSNGICSKKRKLETALPKKCSNLMPKDSKREAQLKSLEEKRKSLQKQLNLMNVGNSKESDNIEQIAIGSSNKSGATQNKIRTYICKFCCRRFSNGDALQSHLKTHQGNSKLACHICGYTTGTFSALMAHCVKHSKMKADNTSKNTFGFTDAEKIVPKKPVVRYCDNCKQEFKTKTLFYSHYCPPSKEKKEFPCVYCRKVTHTVEEYRDHIQSHSPIPHLSCEHCSTKFTLKTQLQRHLKTCLKKPNYIPLKQVAKKAAVKRPRAPRTTRKLTAKQPSVKPCIKKEIVEIESSTIDNKADSHWNFKSREDVSSADACFNQTVGDIQDLNSELPSTKRRRTNTRRKLRPKKLRMTYSSDLFNDSTVTSEPTRRSARLVNKKPIRFSLVSSDSESPEEDKECDYESEPALIAKIQSETYLSQGDVKVTPPKTSLPKIPKKNFASKATASYMEEIASPKKSPLSSQTNFSSKPKKSPIKSPINENKSNTLFCNLCSLIFRSMGSLKRHKKMHTGKPQFVCQFCGKFFFRRDIHRRHESNVHQNVSPSILTCYYCKSIMESTTLLKEHSIATHSNRAAAPERIRRCSPLKKRKLAAKSKSPITDTNSYTSPIIVDIKKEVCSEEEENDSTTSEIKKSSTYNCSTCKLTFNTPSQIAQHFQIVHISEKKPSTSIKNDISLNIKQEPYTEEPEISEENKIDRESTLTETLTDKALEPTSESNENQSNSREDSEPLGQEFIWKTSEHACTICFKPLPDQNVTECIGPDAHKAVEWYQCSVCSAMGPKKSIQDHMIKHMTKIGTFIVSAADREYKDLFRYTRHLNNEVADYTDPEEEFDSSYFQAFPMCTLMEEVTCSMCNEEIVDFQLLANHPCMRSHEGQYFCFVNSCIFSSETVIELHEHMKQLHFKPLFINSEFPYFPSASYYENENHCIDFTGSG